jgi:1-aminocyclopropane-1-carboxylate deaminase/D-cysteine desulfhydrase-like pyridoxal-dependent ACC family enzyme
MSTGRLQLNGADVWRPDQDPLAAPTPVELRGGLWVKRDDAFDLGGVCGGKVRTCWALASDAVAAGAGGLVTAGSRASPQVNIVAHVARMLKVPCRVHTPTGALSPEVVAAREAGAVVVQHRAGYNNVLIARANEDARIRRWGLIPFGMECWEAVDQTARQVVNLPAEARRVVVAVGSGMSLAGILTGLRDVGRGGLPVVGVVVGADPTARLEHYAPGHWRRTTTLVYSRTDYHKPASETDWHGLTVDAHYEAKALPHLRHGDVFWCVGIRQTATGGTV